MEQYTGERGHKCLTPEKSFQALFTTHLIDVYHAINLGQGIFAFGVKNFILALAIGWESYILLDSSWLLGDFIIGGDLYASQFIFELKNT